MRTMKIKTATTTNYIVCIDGYYFVIRQYKQQYSNKLKWEICSFKSNMVGTDECICNVCYGFGTKKESLTYLEKRIKEVPKGFFHNIKEF